MADDPKKKKYDTLLNDMKGAIKDTLPSYYKNHTGDKVDISDKVKDAFTSIKAETSLGLEEIAEKYSEIHVPDYKNITDMDGVLGFFKKIVGSSGHPMYSQFKNEEDKGKLYSALVNLLNTQSRDEDPKAEKLIQAFLQGNNKEIFKQIKEKLQNSEKSHHLSGIQMKYTQDLTDEDKIQMAGIYSHLVNIITGHETHLDHKNVAAKIPYQNMFALLNLGKDQLIQQHQDYKRSHLYEEKQVQNKKKIKQI